MGLHTMFRVSAWQRRAVLGGAVVAATGALLAGCGGSSSGGSSSGSASAAASSPSGSSSSGVNRKAPLYNQLPAAVRSRGAILETVVSHPPYEQVSASGQVTGVAIQLEDAMSKYLGVPFKRSVTSGDLASVLGAISAGRSDLFAGPLNVTPERQAQFDMVAWLKIAGSAFVTKTGTYHQNAAGTFLCGKNVSYAAGSPSTLLFVNDFSKWCKSQNAPPVNASAAQNTTALLLALQSGRAVAIEEADDQAAYLEHQQPGQYHSLSTTRAQGSIAFVQGYVISKGSKLAPVVQKALNMIMQDGTYAKIMKSYGLGAFTVSPGTKA